MPVAGQLAVFSGVIVLGALAGAAVPLRAAGAHRQVAFLAFASGVMLGAAFFHMLPEAFQGGGPRALFLVPAGFVFLFVLERYVLVHVCEEPPDCAEHTHGSTMGLTAFIGLSSHTLFDGVALGSAITEGVGLTTFIAIAAHKIPSSLSLAALLQTEGRKSSSILAFVTVFGLMVPLGALLYFALDWLITFEAFAPLALAFSAGSFLYIAVSDLLPHVNRHGRAERFRGVAGMVLGLGIMLALSWVLGDHAPA
jgi:zinc and cadmium transporter